MSTPAARRVAALEAIVADLSARVAILEHRRQRHDPDADARLLSAIASALGSAVFDAGDLVRHTTHDRELAAVLDGADARQTGLWLRRLHRHPSGAYRLRRVTRGGAGVVWTLDVDADRHTQASVRRDRRAHSTVCDTHPTSRSKKNSTSGLPPSSSRRLLTTPPKGTPIT